MTKNGKWAIFLLLLLFQKGTFLWFQGRKEHINGKISPRLGYLRNIFSLLKTKRALPFSAAWCRLGGVQPSGCCVVPFLSYVCAGGMGFKVECLYLIPNSSKTWVLSQAISQLIALSFMVQLVQCWIRRTFTSQYLSLLWYVIAAIQAVVPFRAGQLSGSSGLWVHLPGLLDIGVMLEMLNLWSDLVMIRNCLYALDVYTS